MTPQPVLRQTWLETSKTGFLTTRLISKNFKSDVEGLIKSDLELRMQDSRDEHFEPRKPSIYVDTGVWLADVDVQNDFSLFWSKTWLYIMGGGWGGGGGGEGGRFIYFFLALSIRKDFLL